MQSTFAIEVPFPNDHAPFKIIRTNAEGVRKIVDSALTWSKAEALLREARARGAR